MYSVGHLETFLHSSYSYSFPTMWCSCFWNELDNKFGHNYSVHTYLWCIFRCCDHDAKAFPYPLCPRSCSVVPIFTHGVKPEQTVKVSSLCVHSKGFSPVGLQMCIWSCGSSAGFPTLCTLIGLPSTVSLCMFVKVGGPSEVFPTFFTLTGLLSSVDS